MDHTTGGARHIITVDDTLDGERLDRALHLLLPELSRSRLKALLAQGHISAGSHLCTDASKKVRTGQSFDIFVPDAVDAIPLGEDLPLSIVYEDEDLLVIDKQAGMTVHPAPGHYEHTLVNALIALLRQFAVRYRGRAPPRHRAPPGQRYQRPDGRGKKRFRACGTVVTTG